MFFSNYVFLEEKSLCLSFLLVFGLELIIMSLFGWFWLVFGWVVKVKFISVSVEFFGELSHSCCDFRWRLSLLVVFLGRLNNFLFG